MDKTLLNTISTILLIMILFMSDNREGHIAASVVMDGLVWCGVCGPQA